MLRRELDTHVEVPAPHRRPTETLLHIPSGLAFPAVVDAETGEAQRPASRLERAVRAAAAGGARRDVDRVPAQVDQVRAEVERR